MAQDHAKIFPVPALRNQPEIFCPTVMPYGIDYRARRLSRA